MGIQEDMYKKKEKEKEVAVVMEKKRLEFDKRRLEFDLQAKKETKEFRLMRTDVEGL
ncbi:hypothetical protein Hdeb2414_s0025g00657631 [Helianthus debilis subsp. tardiflorus]